jgi:hypothetical protein
MLVDLRVGIAGVSQIDACHAFAHLAGDFCHFCGDVAGDRAAVRRSVSASYSPSEASRFRLIAAMPGTGMATISAVRSDWEEKSPNA